MSEVNEITDQELDSKNEDTCDDQPEDLTEENDFGEIEKLAEKLPEFVQDRINILQSRISTFEKEARENMQKLKDLREHAHEDGKKIVKEFLQKSKLTKEDVEKRIDTGINKILESLQVPTKTDIENLYARIDQLNTKLSSLDDSSEEK